MKKISFIIIGGAIALASCNNQPTVDTAKQQAHIDSVLNSFLDSKKADLQKMCDDNIMAAAQDSAKMILEKEKKGIHHVAAKPVAKKVETQPAVNVPTGRTNVGTVGTPTGRQTNTTTGAQSQGTPTGRQVHK